ncbi:MAG: CBS domain-containing protein [Acidobacteria bacterium]|nr:CBS domain-containing protein [Acidobacteriota bacterium]
MVDTVIPTAEDLMARRLVTLTPAMPVLDAMRTLLEHSVSGAPVLDEDGRLCGIVSELDCMRILTSGQFSQDSHDEDACVSDVMTADVQTITPSTDLFAIAQQFLSRNIRRLPVVEHGRLLGMVSRRDVLRGVETMRTASRTQPAARKARGLYLSASETTDDEVDAILE